MRRFAPALSILLIAAFAATAFAYGPSTHMREADRFITLCELHPQPGRQHDPDFLRRLRRFLLLGAIWPDIARLITVPDRNEKVDEGLVDPHNRHFVSWMLNNALYAPPGNEWQIAFAQGNLAHLASDSVSQDMFVEYEAVVGRLAALNALPGVEPGSPDGEDEAFIEGGLEFMEPELSYYIAMIEDFLATAAGRQELATATTYYLAAYHEFFPGARTLDSKAAVAAVFDALADFPNRFPYDDRDGPAAMYQFARTGCRDLNLLAGLTINWQELARLLTGPAITQKFWDRYYDKGYYDLAPTMLLTFHDGQPFFDDFPNWSANLMRSGVIQSLAYYLPETLAVNQGRLTMDLEWYADGSDAPSTSIDAASPPAQVMLQVTFTDSLDAATVSPLVTVVVREDSAGGAIVASASGYVANDPHGYDANPPLTLAAMFDPRPSIANGAAGFFAELREGADASAPLYLTTNWNVYQQITQVDMTQDVYTSQYAVYGKWPYSLQIVYPPPERGKEERP